MRRRREGFRLSDSETFFDFHNETRRGMSELGKWSATTHRRPSYECPDPVCDECTKPGCMQKSPFSENQANFDVVMWRRKMGAAVV